MSTPRLQLRSLMVAVSAIAGMLWASGGAAACETRVTEKATRACCLAAKTPNCGCCDAGPTDTPPPPPAEVATTSSPSAVTFVSEAESCECRVGGPAQPSDKRSERPAEERPERERAESILVLPRLGSTGPSALGRYSSPVGVTAKTPLYLRTSRFLV